MQSKNFIVITSIFHPTEAIETFSKFKDWQVVVVGDKKTPPDWKCSNTIYLPYEEHDSLGYQISKLLPYNHYCRKMIGYLYAIQNNASIIVDTDDDNIPKSNWKIPPFYGYFQKTEDNLGFINVYSHFTSKKIWPRGLPLDNILSEFGKITTTNNKAKYKIGIWQGLVDVEPDVDAIYRLTINEPCIFSKKKPLILGKGTVSPFNSQNTAFNKDLFILLYLPSFVSFRFCDILRSLVAQPILWLYEYNLGFHYSTVIQKRNQHSLMDDFISEIPCYLNCKNTFSIVNESISKNKTIKENLVSAYKSLCKKKIIEEDEVKLLKYWIRDIEHVLKDD